MGWQESFDWQTKGEGLSCPDVGENLGDGLAISRSGFQLNDGRRARGR
jgi:hypothetical protein